MMQQSLLADRFDLKVHFETREMPIFELVPAKGGLKITPVDPPQPGDGWKPTKPGELRPGNMNLSVGSNGLNILNARATTLDLFLNGIRGQAPELRGRPIVSRTGFTGTFDLNDFRFVGLAYTGGLPGTGNASEPDAPSVEQALEQQLGLKLVPAKGQVEVVVIDSIDRPTEN